jgi:hypothetical protein
MSIRINTGKELLDSGITKFNVCNGAWIGEVVIRNNRPHLYCKNYNGTLVNSFSFNNKTELDLIIEPISYEKINISGQIRDVRGVTIGSPINYAGKPIGKIDTVDVENGTFTAVIDKDQWESLVGEETLGFSIEIV